MKSENNNYMGTESPRKYPKIKQAWVYENIHKKLSQGVEALFRKLNINSLFISAFIYLLTFIPAYLFSLASHQSLIIGGMLFYIFAIFKDANLLLINDASENSQDFRQLVFVTTNIIGYTAIFTGLGIGLFSKGIHEFYLYAAIILVFIGLYITGRIGNMELKKLEPVEYRNAVVAEEDFIENIKSKKDWSSYLKMFWGIEWQDLGAFIVLVCCLLNFSIVLFWLAGISAIIVSLGLTKSKGKKSGGFQMPDPFFFYILGVILLCVLIYNMDLKVIGESLSQVGFSVLWVFASAILWVLVNSYSVSILVDHKVPFKTLLYVDLTGNAYNNIIPLAGVGGEPYKIKVMSEHIGINKASRAAIQNRLINSSTAFTFTSIMVFGFLLLVDVETKISNFLLIAACISGLIGLFVSWLTISSAPDKLSGYLLTKSNFLKEYKKEVLSKRKFLGAAFWQIVGRFLNMVEIYLIFVVLGFSPNLEDVVCISAFLSISGAVFFMIPQGLGVSEASISTAFSILGYETSLGLTFGLLRRARVIFWALFGIGLHIVCLIVGRSKEG